MFVTNQHDSTVSAIDAAALKVIITRAGGDYPEGVNVHPDGNRVFVANWFSDDVTVFDTQSLDVIKTISTGNGSRADGIFIPGGS